MANNAFEEVLRAFGSSEVQGCVAAVESILGYELSPLDRQPYLYFHNYITNPQPQFISDWRSTPKLERWYRQLVDGFLSEVQNSFACVLYHQERIGELERSAFLALERHNYRDALGASVLALPRTLRWDFEYQAFVLAYRRCLDYLAKTVCTYFRNDFHSFRTLGENLKKLKPQTVALPLGVVHQKYIQRFEFVLSEGNRKSVRDRISHYGYVSAGTLNLSKQGLMVAGGGEQLGHGHPRKAIALTPMMESHVNNLRDCIREMVFSFVDAARVTETKKGTSNVR